MGNDNDVEAVHGIVVRNYSETNGHVNDGVVRRRATCFRRFRNVLNHMVYYI